MRKEITIIETTCDWCKTKLCDVGGSLSVNGIAFDVCEDCEKEIIATLQPVNWKHTQLDDTQKEKAVEVFAEMSSEKPKRGRKKREEIIQEKSLVSELGLDMRKREDADKVEKVLLEMPEASAEEINEAIRRVPAYFCDCDEHKAMLKTCLESLGFDFLKEEDREDAMTVRLDLLGQRVDVASLSVWVTENVERKDSEPPF